MCSSSCSGPTLCPRGVVVSANSRAPWLVPSSSDQCRELARRAHAAEWLERLQRFRRRQQGAADSVLQPAARRYYTGETLHSGETDSTQSDGGILGRRGRRETERCHVRFGRCGGRFTKAGLPRAEPHSEQTAPLPAAHPGAGLLPGGRPLYWTVYMGGKNMLNQHMSHTHKLPNSTQIMHEYEVFIRAPKY